MAASTLAVVESTTTLTVSNSVVAVAVTETSTSLSVGNSGPQGATGSTGATGATGATGSSGVIAVTAPITNSGTSTSANIGINQAGITIAQSQVTSLVTDLGLKANLASPTFTGTVSGISKSMVGLGSVDNTADSAKPISSATQTALDLKATTTTLSSARDEFRTTDYTDLSVLPRNISVDNLATNTGRIFYTFFTPIQGGTVSQVSVASGTTASSGLTLARIGLYSVDTATETLTLVARTASDTTLFNTQNTLFTRSFNTTGDYPSSYTLVAGTRYALAVIQVGTTPASLLGVAHSSLLTTLDLRIAATALNSDLPGSSSSLSATNARLIYGRFNTA